MKKLLVLFLCLMTLFTVAGCSGKEDTANEPVEEPVNNTSKTIDLGGSLGTITLEGEAFGSYKVVETPEELTFEGVDLTVYEDLDSDTPYIMVFRFPKGDYTLETFAQEEADRYCNGYYQLFDSNDMVSCGGAYICNPYASSDGNFYYTDTQILEDGDDFVEISCLGKTEELQIGDTNVYAYVPVGYTSLLNDDYNGREAYFAATYSDDYYFPNIFVGKWDYSYDYLKWYYEDDYPEGLPISEEEHAKLLERISNGEDVTRDFYELLGLTIVYDSYQDEKQSFDFNGGYFVLQYAESEGSEAWFEVDGNWYVAWIGSDLSPKPAYTSTFLASLHTK